MSEPQNSIVVLESIHDLARVFIEWHKAKLDEFENLLATAPTQAHADTLSMVIERLEELPFDINYTVNINDC